TVRVVNGDGFLLTWVLQELLTNAIRFCGEGPPRVRISDGDGGPGDWDIAVSDNGPGIEPVMAERAVRPFKKLTAAGGAGIGRTVCRKIIELHGGQIWVEPREEGAELRFFLGATPACE